MKNELGCAIVRDLLPSYIDELASEETTNAVNQHLASCPECREALNIMKEPSPGQKINVGEIDYLKKVRKHGSRKAIIIGVSLLIIGLLIFALRVFYVGFSADASDVSFEVTVEDSYVEVQAHALSNGNSISRVTFSDSNGMVQVKAYTAPNVFFNSGDCTKSYDASCKIARVQMGKLILWENGKEIGQTAAKLYAAANPYVGDMAANSNITAILGVEKQFGPCKNELQTSKSPYGWTLILDEKIAKSNLEVAHDQMLADSCVMLATIDNLGSVTWKYLTDHGDKKYTVTAEDASKHCGVDIKTCRESADKFQKVLRSLGIQ